jgi:acyl-CoA thioesterase-1
LLLLLVAVMGLPSGLAQEARTYTSKEILAPITDTPGWPRVLLIGDSISIGYTMPVRELLAGEANVHRIPVNGQSTDFGLTHIDAWLGDGPWDVIHFNWGIWDTHILETGAHRNSLEAYTAALGALVERMKATNARLIFATTTPFGRDKDGKLSIRCADVVRYNEAATPVMRAAGVEINDLYALALPRLQELQQEDGVHFTPEGSRVLAAQVAGKIREALGAPAQHP